MNKVGQVLLYVSFMQTPKTAGTWTLCRGVLQPSYRTYKPEDGMSAVRFLVRISSITSTNVEEKKANIHRDPVYRCHC